MPSSIKLMPFRRTGETLIQGRAFDVAIKLKKAPITLHDFSKVQGLFTNQPAFRGQILKLNEGIDLVAGEVNGQTFVLEAVQAEELLKNAVDAENLIAGLNP